MIDCTVTALLTILVSTSSIVMTTTVKPHLNFYSTVLCNKSSATAATFRNNSGLILCFYSLISDHSKVLIHI